MRRILLLHSEVAHHILHIAARITQLRKPSYCFSLTYILYVGCEGLLTNPAISNPSSRMFSYVVAHPTLSLFATPSYPYLQRNPKPNIPTLPCDRSADFVACDTIFFTNRVTYH